MIEKLLKDIQAMFKGTGDNEPEKQPETMIPTSDPEGKVKMLYHLLNR